MSDPQFRFDRTGRILSFNDAAAAVLGMTADTDVRRLLPEPRLLETALSAIGEHGVHASEVTLSTALGTQRPSLLLIAPVPDGSGAFTATTVDISRERSTQMLVKRFPEATMVLDLDRQRVLEADARACEMHGYSREELIGLPLHRLHPPDEDPAPSDPVVHVRKDGQRLLLDVAGRALQIGERRLSITLLRDLTGRLRVEEFYRVLLEQSRDCIFLVDPESMKIVDVNDAAARQRGYERHELLGKSVLSLHPPEESAEIERQRKETLQQGGGVLTGLRHRRKDGTEFPIEISASPISFGERRYYLAIARDVSRRHEAERQLQEAVESAHRSEELYRVLFEQARETVLLLEAETMKIIDINEAGARLRGYERSELIGRDIRELHPPHDIERTEDARRRALETGGTLLTGLWHRRKDGTEFPVEISTNVVTIDGRRCFLSVLRDVSAHHEYERRLRDIADKARQAEDLARRQAAELAEAKQFLELIQEGASDGLVLTDDQGRIVSANRKTLGMRGFRREEYIGRSFFEVTDPANHERYRRLNARILAGEDVRLRSRERTADGKEVVLDISNSLIVRGGRKYVFSIVRDVTEEVRVQERLTLYREIIANSNEGIAIIDVQGRYLEQNAAHRALLGFTDEELAGRTPAIHIMEPPFEVIARELADKGFFRGEVASRTKDGVHRDLDLSAFSVRDAEGRPACFVGIKRDITERKRATRRQAAEHAVTRVLAEASTLPEAVPRIVEAVCRNLGWNAGAVWTEDPPRNALSCTEFWHAAGIDIGDFERATRRQTFARGLGLPGRVYASASPEWVEDIVQERQCPRGPQAERAGLHAAFAFPIMLRGEVLGVIEFFSRAILPRDEDLLVMMGSIGSQIGQFIERKRAEEQLRKLSHAVEQSPSIVVITDPAGTIEYVNPKFTEVTGYSPEEIRGSAARGLGIQSAEDEERMLRMLRAGQAWRGEFHNLKKNGDRYWERASISPVRDEHGAIVHYVKMAEDTTELKRAEERLKRAVLETRRAYARLKRMQAQLVRSERLAASGMLLSGVAHEINNPINVISGNLKLLRERCRRLDELVTGTTRSRGVRAAMRAVPTMLADATRAAEHARRVIDEFRAFARDPRAAEDADLNQCVETVLASLKQELAGIRVERRLGKLPPVRCVPAQIQHAVRNLVENAIEAMEGQGTLTLRTRNGRRRVAVSVTDTGRGIPRENRKKVLEPFFTTKSEGQGMGLGLPICVTIAQNHGGHVDI
ncbi:MAG: PAS domain S-box protein, partial [Planctomycetes bacterium]|nr:PAS domain S-box protein [Planctomycetota bacterium]